MLVGCWKIQEGQAAPEIATKSKFVLLGLGQNPKFLPFFLLQAPSHTAHSIFHTTLVSGFAFPPLIQCLGWAKCGVETLWFEMCLLSSTLAY